MDRKKFLGSSDIAAAMGVDRWRTPLQLWAEKTGEVEPEDISGNEYIELGTELEDFIAKKFERKTGMKVRRAPQRYIHKEYPWMACQVDRLITGTGELLECKNASAWKEKEWAGEEIPVEYILQVSWQLMITGRTVGYIAVLIGGNKFRYKKIEADQSLFDEMITKAKVFWQMVQEKTPPTAEADDNSFMIELFPKSGEALQAAEHLNTAVAQLQELKGHIARMDEEKDLIEAQIKQVIGDTAGIRTQQYIVTWKSQDTKRLDIEALKKDNIYDKYLKTISSRILRVNKNKERE